MATTSERRGGLSCYVHVQLPGQETVVPAARFQLEVLADGSRIGRLRYGERYLARPDAVALDPAQLPLSRQVHEVSGGSGLPPALVDAGPDDWGRRLIAQGPGPAAGSPGTDSPGLGPLDAALGLAMPVVEACGALSFAATTQIQPGHFQGRPAHELPALAGDAQALASGRDLASARRLALISGWSLASTRPKVTVSDGGSAWVAVLPATDALAGAPDRLRLRQATLELARRCGLDVAPTRLMVLGGQSCLLVRRPDREARPGGWLRHLWLSGRTLIAAPGEAAASVAAGEDGVTGSGLAGTGGEDRRRWSWLLLADGLRRWSTRPGRDCRELFRRMAFCAAVSAVNLGPRSQGLVHRDEGWRLAPVLDLAADRILDTSRRELAMVIGDHGRLASRANLVSRAGRFGLERPEAEAIVDEVVGGVGQWQACFAAVGVPAVDRAWIAPAMLPACFFLAPG